MKTSDAVDLEIDEVSTSISRTSSNISSQLFEPEVEFYSVSSAASDIPSKLLSYFEWFRDNKIYQGDPRSIEEEHFKNKREKILEAIRQQNNAVGQQQKKNIPNKRGFKCNLVINTKV